MVSKETAERLTITHSRVASFFFIIAALSATAMLAPEFATKAFAQAFPTAKVNTTGLAVTDTEVTVGDPALGDRHDGDLGNGLDPGQ